MDILTIKDVRDLLVAVLPVLFTFFGIWIKKQLLNYRSRRFKLNQHTLFSSINNYLRELKTWNVQQNRVVFLDAFTIKLTKWKDDFSVLADKLQNAKFNNSKLESEISNSANQTIINYLDTWNLYGIPSKVIDRINEINDEKIDMFMNKIKSKSHNDDMYPVYMLKVIAIFDVLELLLAETINDLNTLVFREKYNGHFKNVVYRGIPVNDEQFKEFKQNKNK